ncbi:hypothetical protein [Bacillus phage vB_BanS-Thrax2]|nr:hypothetical protein [Bacillus phage vB_BanS-Thrax2]
MAWDEAKTKEDFINLLNEINAYRELDGQDFDFGTGLIKNDMSFGSEDAYYEMDIWSLESIIENFDYPVYRIKKKRKQRPNKHARKRKQIQDMERMRHDDNWFYPVYNNDKYNKRYYRGKRSAFLKKVSSKKIRNHKGSFQPKGNKHKRVFDFWWELE